MVKKVAVIGGGASGIMAAITAAGSGAEVTVFEKNDRVGKKLLVTGNGKCNYSNRDFNIEYYNGSYKEKLPDIFAQFTTEDTVDFFNKAGMLSKDKNGYLYPLSEQASTVLDILRLQLKNRQIKIKLSAEVRSIKKNKSSGMFTVNADTGEDNFHRVIISSGGCAASKTGSDGSGYPLAKSMGHTIVDTVPALVQLRCSDNFFKSVAGVRCDAFLELVSGDRICQRERGELQLTDYGISGIPVFQLSRTAAYLLKDKQKVNVFIDFFPGWNEKEYEEMCSARMETWEGKTGEEFLLGMANKKVNMLLLKLAGIKPEEQAAEIDKEKLKKLLFFYRRLCVHVIDTNSFDNAQVSAGGINMEEVTLNMESALVPGLYFAGEVLDVDGRCGGYNLQWAWTSGYIAGRNAAL